MHDRKFQRLVVVGTSSSGKTTFACKLAQALHLAHIELRTQRQADEFLHALKEKAG